MYPLRGPRLPCERTLGGQNRWLGVVQGQVTLKVVGAGADITIKHLDIITLCCYIILGTGENNNYG